MDLTGFHEPRTLGDWRIEVRTYTARSFGRCDWQGSWCRELLKRYRRQENKHLYF